jgi:hypothetical protein
MEFRSLNFQKTSHSELSPPIFDGDHTYGDDYGVGQLMSLACAKKDKALVFVVRFGAGPDAEAAGWRPDEIGEIEFALFERKGRYFGQINQTAPTGFAETLEKGMQILDVFGAGPAPGHKGRNAAHFFCYRFGFKQKVCLTVTVYIRKGWFGGWKEIVVKVPKKTLYVSKL